MKKLNLIFISFCFALCVGCGKQETINSEGETITNDSILEKSEEDLISKEDIIEEIKSNYESKTPTQWGEKIDGVVSNINTDEKIVALTFDACGGKNGSGYDKELIDYLINENIPATLFVNYRWIEANKDIFLELANNELFEIENHGYEHRPLSVADNSIYGINGTNSIDKVIEEIKLNENVIYELTGKKTRYFRSGTAYYDDIAVQIAEDLGYKLIGYSVNGDGGATFAKTEVENIIGKSKEGDIVICHFNQPQKYTYEGIKEALIELKNKGYKFTRLEEVDDLI
ncbi:MAG: polysaccharide deacetylase family protein [Peptostreptococcaceae bacterium]